MTPRFSSKACLRTTAVAFIAALLAAVGCTEQRRGTAPSVADESQVDQAANAGEESEPTSEPSPAAGKALEKHSIGTLPSSEDSTGDPLPSSARDDGQLSVSLDSSAESSRDPPQDPATKITSPQPLSIAVSAGVALPQPLPTGTAMGFSLDYRITAGRRETPYQYAWVIEAENDSPPHVQPIRLQDRGTLQTFVTRWKPRHGPFRSYLAKVRPDGSREAISPIADMK